MTEKSIQIKSSREKDAPRMFDYVVSGNKREFVLKRGRDYLRIDVFDALKQMIDFDKTLATELRIQ